MSFFTDASTKHVFGKKGSTSSIEESIKNLEEDWPECDQTEEIIVERTQASSTTTIAEPLKDTKKARETTATATTTATAAIGANRAPIPSPQKMFKIGSSSNFGSNHINHQESSTTKRHTIENAREQIKSTSATAASAPVTTNQEVSTKRKEPATPTVPTISEKRVASKKRPSVGHVIDCGGEIESNLQRLVITLRSMEKPVRELADEYRVKIRVLCDMQFK